MGVSGVDLGEEIVGYNGLCMVGGKEKRKERDRSHIKESES
jgi:hypothetical protein